MKLKEGSILYIRTDYKIGDKHETDKDAEDCMEYLMRTAKERYLVAGMLGDMEAGKIDGSMILFEAKNLEEAKEVSDNDPIIKRGFYRYELQRWNVMFSSEDTVN